VEAVACFEVEAGVCFAVDECFGAGAGVFFAGVVGGSLGPCTGGGVADVVGGSTGPTTGAGVATDGVVVGVGVATGFAAPTVNATTTNKTAARLKNRTAERLATARPRASPNPWRPRKRTR
jgi:hypothetical protein